jgi:hypothetical protein
LNGNVNENYRLPFEMLYCVVKSKKREYKEEVNEVTVQFVGGGFGLPKTEGFLPIQLVEKKKEESLFDLQTVAFWVLKNAIIIADTHTLGPLLSF